MRIVRDPIATPPCVLVLGTFDGVHRGHQALLMKGLELADKYSVALNVCTFDPHPLMTLHPEKMPPLLTTLTEKARLMADFGVDTFCVMTFSREYASQTPQEYLTGIMNTYHPKAVVCGFNHTFGAKGKGTVEDLYAWGEENHVEIAVIPEFRLDGETVSSTVIREHLAQGNIHRATVCMGHWYTMTGRVENGKHLGRTMGYPTANVHIPTGKVMPAFGVYACWLTVEGKSWPAVVNVGRHPTLPEGQVTVEAHVLEKSLMLYGKKVRLSFLNYQRPEKLFAGMDELQQQITQDAEDAKAYFAQMGD